MSEDKRDVIEVLAHDHREVEEMFDELTSATDPDERRRIVDDITIELVRHAVAEEMYLYPAVRKHVPGGDALADEETSEHSEIEQMLKDLEGVKPTDADFTTLTRRLMDVVNQHVKEEESTLFPRFAEHAGPDALVELGEKVQKAKRVAPTRPHPAAPDHPPLNKLLAPGTGLIDRVRDHLSGRGSD